MELSNQEIQQQYLEYINKKEFACVAAKAALGRHQIQTYVAHNIMCPADDSAILEFIYKFIDTYRASTELYHSATVIFKGPIDIPEEQFDAMMWKRLQALSDMDAKNYSYDERVQADPSSNDFSFSLKQEAFFIIGLHSNTNRLTRQFNYPTLVFNPHAQFEQLKQTSKYSNLQSVVRKRDIAVSGSINPMLQDFGNASEVYQYSGRAYDNKWECPLKIHHAKHNSAA